MWHSRGRHCPQILVLDSGEADRPTWLTVDLLRQIRRKRQLWKKLRTSLSGENERAYREEEKSLNKKIRLAKSNMEKNIAQNTDNSKKFHTNIRSRTKSKSGVGPLKVGDRTVTEEQEMAETLNGYFSSVFNKRMMDKSPRQS